jgi:putative spermidine/putrescine transport system ATP-binding protein
VKATNQNVGLAGFDDKRVLLADTDTATPVVSLRGISKTYGDFTAVDNLSLDVKRGELLCLLGPSGCGKTTTLRMVAGFVEPTAGSVYISGQDVTALPPYRRDTGMVFQSYALFPHMTIGANIAFGLENIGIPKAERARRVEKMLTLVELTDLTHRYPRELSGGQQQRVALARALALRPAVLLLDEPFSNLDAQLRVRLREELRLLIDRVDITTLFVTHDQEEALMLSDRIVVINQGKIEQIGTPEDIYERPASRFVAEFVGWCSILEGVVSNGTFVSQGGLTLPVNAPAGQTIVVVRPEYIKPVMASSDRKRLKGRVESSNYYGAMSRLSIAVDGEKLLMETHFPPGARPAVNDEIEIEIDPVGIRAIPTSPENS